MAQFNAKALAEYCLAGEREMKEIKKITADLYPNLSVEEAYLVQEQLVGMKLEEGYRILGPKMGLTSWAKMKQMGVEEAIYGYVFDYMVVDNKISLSELIHPKVEAEIAFVMGQDLEGPGVTAAQALAATDYVVGALEIIDSRYENFNFTLPDVIADNASSARVVFGNVRRKPSELDLDLVGITLSINGELKDLGAGAAVLGHPAASIAMLANMLSRKGLKIKKGDVILSGGVTGAVLLSEGDHVTAKLDGLGEIAFTVAP